MVRKVKQNISRNTVVVLVVSVLVIAVVIGVLYPLLQEKGVTGKAVAVPPEEKYAYCSVQEPGFAGYLQQLVPAGNGAFYNALCVNKEKSLGIRCQNENGGYVKNVANGFDALCFPSFAGALGAPWVECNADGAKESNGEGIIPFPVGRMSGGKYLCAQNGLFESWFACPLGNSIGNGVNDQQLVSTSNGDYLCFKEEWKHCDASLKNKGLPEADGKTVLFYCQEKEGKLKWNQCSSTENNGKITNNQVRYCDGKQWQECELSVKGPSSNKKYWCSGTVWKECTADNKNKYSLDQKYRCDGAQWVATAAAEQPPQSYTWEQAPISSKSLATGEDIKFRVKVGKETKESVGNYFCPSKEYCANVAFSGGDASSDYCYSENTKFENILLCGKDEKGGLWLSCEDKEQYVAPNENYLCFEKEWHQCIERGVKGVQFYCDGIKWNECSSEIIGKATENDEYVCNGISWSTTFVLDTNHLYEIKLIKDGGAKELQGPLTKLSTLSLCDSGTEKVPFKTTVCSFEGGNVPISSNSFLAGSNEKIYVKDDLLFQYTETLPKTVTVHLVLHPNQKNGVNLPLGTLADNLIAGRRPVIELDGQYYLLTHPQQLFSPAEVQLLSLPSLTPIEVKKLSSQKYQFVVQAKKYITLTLVGDTISLAVGKPTEAIAGQVENHNLESEYEVPFSKEKPVNLLDFGTQLVPCLSDTLSDPAQLLVCLNEQDKTPFVSLPQNVLIKKALPQQLGEGGLQDVALLYQWDPIAKKKQGYVFYLNQLGKLETKLSYEDFVSNLVDLQKRIALEFAGNLYLMGHGGNVLALPQINLTSYTGGSVTHYGSGSQSEKTVDFLIAGGKVTLSRQLISPPPPFTLSVQTTEELLANPLDLTQELSTSLSSQVPVMIVNPVNYGVLSQDTTSTNADVLGFKPLFKVKGDAEGQQQLSLQFQKPIVDGNSKSGFTLLYYYGAEQKDGGLVKSARVYYYYNLTDVVADTHTFDDAFLDTFMGKGREMVLGFGNGYYVLSYAGATPLQKSFFEFEKLALTSLDGTQKFTPVVDGLQASFAVPEGTIVVNVDQAVTKMTFTKKGAQEIAQEAVTESFDPLQDYKYTLVPGNIVNIDGVSYEICDKGAYLKVFDRVQLCRDGNFYKTVKEKDFLTENGVLIYFKYDSKLKQKQLILERYVDLSVSKAGAIVTNDKFFSLPLEKMGLGLKWNDEWYELGDMTLIKLDGTGFCGGVDNAFTADVETLGSVGYVICESNTIKEGKIIVSTTSLLKVVKEVVETTGDVLFTLSPTTYKLASSIPVEVKNTETFLEPADENSFAYDVKVSYGTVLADVVLSVDKKVFFKASLPEGVTRQVLLPDGKTIKIKVVDIKQGIITVST
ncbi:hypothetical protein HYT55_01745 [Candidatus Woesearchaeota archaeon]|nr:hypothetical protein [Candidatus Woesearchaeota archaeon]